MNTPTVGQLFDFIKANKTDKVFIGLSDSQIVTKLYDAIAQNALVYSMDGDKVSGIILAEIDKDQKYIWVAHNLALTLDNLKKFAKWCYKHYPNFTVDWKKHGRYKKRNIQKLYHKLGVI